MNAHAVAGFKALPRDVALTVRYALSDAELSLLRRVERDGWTEHLQSELGKIRVARRDAFFAAYAVELVSAGR